MPTPSRGPEREPRPEGWPHAEGPEGPPDAERPEGLPDAEAGSPAQGVPEPAPQETLRGLEPADYHRAQQSGEFQQLKGSFRRFAFPMTVAFLVWYFGYVLLSVYARGLMSVPVIGTLNIGLLWGLAQFVSTFLITWLYIRHANRSIDPLAGQIRAELEEAAE